MDLEKVPVHCALWLAGGEVCVGEALPGRGALLFLKLRPEPTLPGQVGRGSRLRLDIRESIPKTLHGLVSDREREELTPTTTS